MTPLYALVLLLAATATEPESWVVLSADMSEDDCRAAANRVVLGQDAEAVMCLEMSELLLDSVTDWLGPRSRY